MDTVNGIDLVLALLAASGWGMALVYRRDYRHAHARGSLAGVKQAAEWQKVRESQNEVQSGMLRVVPPRKTAAADRPYDHAVDGL